MHYIVFNKFNKILEKSGLQPKKILEIGSPSVKKESLLFMKSLPKSVQKFGIDQNGPYNIEETLIQKMDANNLSFRSNMFDLVVCNSVLEHDPLFWLTLDELKRVLKKGGLLIIGVPGFSEKEKYYVGDACTVTLNYHRFPDDYYRFSTAAVKNIFLKDLKDTHCTTIMKPPRIIGWGWKR